MRLRNFVAILIVACLSLSCWDRVRTYRSGDFAGFKIGDSKRVAFDHAIASQQLGRVQDLKLVDASPATYADKYKGTPILPDDFGRVSASDEWHLGRPECNCWIRLHFSEDRLRKIEEHEWEGPTE